MSRHTQTNYIEALGHELGIPNIHPKLAKILENAVQMRLKIVMQDALKFCDHSNRKKLIKSDVLNSLKMMNAPPMLGTHETSFQSVLQTNSKKSSQFLSNSHHSNILIANDPIKSLNNINLNSIPIKPPPLSVSVQWLAINGNVPNNFSNNNTFIDQKPKTYFNLYTKKNIYFHLTLKFLSKKKKKPYYQLFIIFQSICDCIYNHITAIVSINL